MASTFVLDDGHGLELAWSDLGATWLSCRVPVGGELREVLLGHPRVEDHLAERGYLGATVGRFANRIAGARFVVDGREVRLASNEGRHQLHGGPDGFHRRRWLVSHASRRELVLHLVSADGDQGYPGRLEVDWRCRIDARGAFTVGWQLRCSAACPVSLTQHAYFNLDGGAGHAGGHRLTIAAREVLPVDDEHIPTGARLPVAGTRHDFRRAAPLLGPDGAGFDHNYCLDAACRGGRRPAAVLESADRRLALELATDLPGLQLYTAQDLAGVRGRDGAPLRAQCGAALEPQFFPDCPNRPDWLAPGCVVRPGVPVAHFVRYRFVARA